ncbi:Probable anion transporter ATPase [Mycobacteroides abscessus subsp. massiliense]|nr:Probable anion transporter ATPase [Mycobacteroides abscessus subsp. massiliense]
MEKLGQLLHEDKWDLIVVDTPPSRNALDFLDAPKRLGSFMDGRLWKMLLGSSRGLGRIVTGAVGRRSSDRNYFPTLQCSCNLWTPRSEDSARRLTAPMSCCADAAPSSSWCRPPNPMRCVRPPSSSSG